MQMVVTTSSSLFGTIMFVTSTKLSRPLRCKEVCSQSVVGTFKIVVKNHFSEPVSSAQPAKMRPPFHEHVVRSQRYVRVAMYKLLQT